MFERKRQLSLLVACYAMQTLPSTLSTTSATLDSSTQRGLSRRNTRRRQQEQEEGTEITNEFPSTKCMKEQQFVNICIEALDIDHDGDGFISENDFATFLTSTLPCLSSPAAQSQEEMQKVLNQQSDCLKPPESFFSLPLSIQFYFLDAVCDQIHGTDVTVNVKECVAKHEQNVTEGSFGFALIEGNQDQLSPFCEEIYADVIQQGYVTECEAPRPSSTPSSSPSKRPTSIPSKTPTASPTRVSSESPSKAPSSSPTKSSTRIPSISPSGAPSRTPVETALPSSNPSVVPIQSTMPPNVTSSSLVPTSAPSPQQITGTTNSTNTRAPTSPPTSSPTKTKVYVADPPSSSGPNDPANDPPHRPAQRPTREPTAGTAELDETPSPTPSPIVVGTPSPTKSPVALFVSTPKPTQAKVTQAPTRKPTSRPTPASNSTSTGVTPSPSVGNNAEGGGTVESASTSPPSSSPTSKPGVLPQVPALNDIQGQTFISPLPKWRKNLLIVLVFLAVIFFCLICVPLLAAYRKRKQPGREQAPASIATNHPSLADTTTGQSLRRIGMVDPEITNSFTAAHPRPGPSRSIGFGSGSGVGAGPGQGAGLAQGPGVAQGTGVAQAPGQVAGQVQQDQVSHVDHTVLDRTELRNSQVERLDLT